MRKIILLEFISLDGVIQAPGGPDEDTSGGFKYGGWTVPFFDDFAGKIMNKQMSVPFSLLLGRKTFDIFASYWPNHTEGWPGINEAIKYVVSTTLSTPRWENSIIIDKDIITKLKKIKNEKGPDMQVFGSSELTHTLLENDLVDEMWLKIFPIILGKGKRLFDKNAIPTSFELIESKVSPKGVIFANYKRKGKVQTGSF